MEIDVKKFENKKDMYDYVDGLLLKMFEESDDLVANLSNASALLNLFLEDINWVGFYLMKGETLALGPFQGKPAVTHIRIGKGVCGTAVAQKKTQRVDDVHACENHIACDIASSSEIVVPMTKGGHILGVLDIDSPIPGRFDEDDERGLENFVKTLVENVF